MKILLLQAHLGRKEPGPPIFPIGLAYLAGALQGHDARIVDLNLWPWQEALDRLGRELEQRRPEVVGLSIRNIDTTNLQDLFYYFRTVAPTARAIKQTLPNALLIAGGPGFSIFGAEIMERVPELDLGVHLEAEESLPELLSSLEAPERVKGVFHRDGGAVRFTGNRPPPDFAALPVPRRGPELIDLEPYLCAAGDNMGIQTKRGCALTCAYCNYPYLTGHALRMRSPESVADEIEYLQGLGLSSFSFVDNIFNVPVSHAEAICREILRRKLEMHWSAWYEIGSTTPELVRLARDAGCRHFGFSPDAATDAMLGVLKKGISREELDRSIRIVRETPGIRAGYNFFMLPDMSPREVWQTAARLVTIPLATRGRARVMGMGWIRVEPHTDLFRRAVESGLLAQDAEMLPRDEEGLRTLFYCRVRPRPSQAIAIAAFRLLEYRLKPFLKALAGRGRGSQHAPA